MFHTALRRFSQQSALRSALLQQAAPARFQPSVRHLSQRAGSKATGQPLSKLSSVSSSSSATSAFSSFSGPALVALRQFATRSGAVGLTSQAKMGWAIAGGAALLGIAAMSADGLAQQQQPRTSSTYQSESEDIWDTATELSTEAGKALGVQSGSRDAALMPAYVRERLAATYGYVLGGLGLTTASAAAFLRAGIYTRGMGGAIIAMVGTMATMYATQAIPKEQTLLKHAAWATFNGCIGLTLVPIAAMGGPLVLKGALITAGVIGGISAIAASAPSETFLWTRGPLSIGLGIVFASSIGSMFFPASALLHNIWMYGGLAVFGGFTLYDTSRVIKAAEVLPAQQFDPINMSISLYMDTINIFIRIMMMLQGGNNSRRRN
mmetsp:Transcript_10543/g.26548  ORF Transcript_10543/g.26548 Transcript_10543/m.26548 type:complete len:379 (+) Transcript_10543:86-1222(+)|eukprot:CAMPEP_0177659700 /NCGR_PEP_ID=MMETSP0447-20121125/17591_1 /TAXON_ID=0 /ORGANISM="Stygamoeba regulata, Strain BSH-02190019" /LENGTH=378 /DNA_ID=CAMNT_0019164605 /DNA_START=63 /DNA_END=1199 /DNA_ORIENTATION=-